MKAEERRVFEKETHWVTDLGKTSNLNLFDILQKEQRRIHLSTRFRDVKTLTIHDPKLTTSMYCQILCDLDEHLIVVTYQIMGQIE
jgi:hypothetical protein